MQIHKMKYGVTYTTQLCTESTIDQDYELVRDYVTDVPEKWYKNRMHKAITNGLSGRVLKDGITVGFLYTLYKKDDGEGVSIFSSDPVGLLILLKDIFSNYPKVTITFTPHNPNPKLLLSLVTGYSIRNYHNHKTPLVVKIKRLEDKINSLYSVLRFE